MFVPPPMTQGMLDLFDGPLRDVRFPDADADRLAFAIDAANEASVAVAKAEAALGAAREALAEKARLVASETEHALAYVRVYAIQHPEVQARLDAMSSRPAVQRRGPGRPRKKHEVSEVTEAAAAE